MSDPTRLTAAALADALAAGELSAVEATQTHLDRCMTCRNCWCAARSRVKTSSGPIMPVGAGNVWVRVREISKESRSVCSHSVSA